MSFFCCYSNTVQSNPEPYATFPSYTSAGVTFTDSTSVLAGVQTFKTLPCLSGIGGKRERSDVDWCHTAWREAVEELIGAVPSIRLLTNIRSSIRSDSVIDRSGYIMIRCTFKDLEIFLRLCKAEGISSPYYKTLPRTVAELVLNRVPTVQGEIGALALLPLRPLPLIIDKQFQGDLRTL